MASRAVVGVDDVDLIDLEAASSCVTQINVADAALEEQEHLLDVCPPKLEQKLSLSRRGYEHSRSLSDGDASVHHSILVTLGHDQVVPVRRRIDVVSSDTIERVRDITRNLEPVISVRSLRGSDDCCQEDRVDSGKQNLEQNGGKLADEDASFEAQQINDAFNFLSELDDFRERDGDEYDEMVPNPKRPRLSEASFAREASHPPCRSSMGAKRQDSKRSIFTFDNEAFEHSPTAECPESDERPTSMKLGLDGSSAARSTLKLLKPLTCSTVAFDAEPLVRGVKSCPYRKSWSGCSSPRKINRGMDPSDDRVRTARLDDKRDLAKQESPRCGLTHYNRICIPVGRNNDSGGCISLSSSPSPCEAGDGGSSTCSDVDWSWVEEVERCRLHQEVDKEGADQGSRQEKEARMRPPSGKRPIRIAAASAVEEFAEFAPLAIAAVAEAVAASVAMPVAATAPAHESPSACPERDDAPPPREQHHHDPVASSDDSEALRPLHSDGSRSPHNGSIRAAGGTLPWLRLSMRRLRQIRLPESLLSSARIGNPSELATAAPNSLPDIALIAPEILAAQTNDTSGNLLRPSSAPDSVRRGCCPAPSSPTASGSAGNSRTAPQSTPRRGRRCQLGQSPTPAPTRPPPPPPCAAPSAVTTSAPPATNATTISTATTTLDSIGTGTTGTPLREPDQTPNPTTNTTRVCERQRDASRDDERGEEDDDDESNHLGKWPHALSPALACVGCTLGLFNISRFAILSVQFGANFMAQFLILSIVIGIPLLTLQVCLGQRLAAGVVDMWKISPLFQGVGIALLVAQAFIGIYSIVGVSWMFVYFRDSFITKQDRYRWSEPFSLYRDDARPSSSGHGSHHVHSGNPNSSSGSPYKLLETVPDYFSGAVLQRHHLNEPDPGVVTLKFQVAFNLAVVWMIVFVSLSKGLRSYGKVVYVFTLVPIFGTLLLCMKLLGLTPPGSIGQLLPATVWQEFFINGRSWFAASSEVFLTWGLLGAAAMQIAAHNKHKHLLQRDAGLVIVLTLGVLLLAAFLANTCVQILRNNGYIYMTSSFERISNYGFLRPASQPAPLAYSSTPERFMSHASFVVGQRVTRPGSDVNFESGYQVLRLCTELVPATLSILGAEQVSPFWAVLFYFTLILFGIAQQLAIWHCVITGIMAINTKMMKMWETTITFFSCACAYVLGLPMATELGIYVVYYLDYTVGGAWWIMVLYLVQVSAVFAVRGRPHTGDAVVTELFPLTSGCLRYWAAPLLSFTWNVVLPISLTVVSIMIFKGTGYRELYSYRRSNRDYWSIWARQLGATIQLIPLLIVPLVAIVQTCRYLNNGPPDIFDRIQLLYRPPLDQAGDGSGGGQLSGGNGSGANGAGGDQGAGLVSSATELPFEDPPPKYTPPPSYSTATGARIAKMLRQSFRRSVRRIASVLGEAGLVVGPTSANRPRPALQQQQQQPPPPDYAHVLVEMNQSGVGAPCHFRNGLPEARPDVANTRPSSVGDGGARRHQQQRCSTMERSTYRGFEPRHQRGPSHPCAAVSRSRTLAHGNGRPSSGSGGSSTLTAAEVANLLRSSIRRAPHRRSLHHQPHKQQPSSSLAACSFSADEPRSLQAHHEAQQSAASVENLVEAAAPIGQDSLVLVCAAASQAPREPSDDKTAVQAPARPQGSLSVI